MADQSELEAYRMAVNLLILGLLTTLMVVLAEVRFHDFNFEMVVGYEIIYPLLHEASLRDIWVCCGRWLSSLWNNYGIEYGVKAQEEYKDRLNGTLRCI
ncbi:putative transmembrane protein [Gregarina niphandrodes]|uniref:Transmembrane protein n=1 Tax=Gregarina niphandrodes TaxID=110365 RepID=A0A023B0R6_GRENI|nr:putative transmembrane protein [Gregarina niphandrodes]EZG45747.1 putative transmembrane protein [Gregarina niphandrodes]|eukprot:XP_011132453.1 putative transmembrane protein [Gregarina niphandrodes]